MKIRSDIDVQCDRYRVQIDTLGFTANEEELLLNFGEPQIDIGSAFTGTVTRPSQVNSTVVITPTNGGTGAAATLVINADGTINSVNITSGGTGYSTAPTISFAGDGTGATATAVVTGGVVTQILVTAAGYGYHAVPYTVSWTDDAALRRIRTDFPIVRVFDLNDYPDADARAKVFSDTIVARLTAAKVALLTQSAPFTGEALVTV